MTAGGIERTFVVLDEVLEERNRQDARWGTQSHPSFDQALLARPGGCTPARMAEEYEVCTEERAKFIINAAVKAGGLTFAHILIEEVAEAIATCAEDERRTRAELVQVAAVAVAWIEAIDRRLPDAKADA